MSGRLAIVPALLLALLVSSGTALAQQAGDVKLREVQKLLAPEPGNRSCWQRVYDKAHLKQHGKQQVTEMTFLLRVRGFNGQGEYTKKNPDHITYQFAIAAKRRGDKREWTAGGECYSPLDSDQEKVRPDAVRCAVECDGGGAFVEQAEGDGLMVRPFDYGIFFGEECGEENAYNLKPGADDKAFLLKPVPAARCDRLEKNVYGKQAVGDLD